MPITRHAVNHVTCAAAACRLLFSCSGSSHSVLLLAQSVVSVQHRAPQLCCVALAITGAPLSNSDADCCCTDANSTTYCVCLRVYLATPCNTLHPKPRHSPVHAQAITPTHSPTHACATTSPHGLSSHQTSLASEFSWIVILNALLPQATKHAHARGIGTQTQLPA